MKKYRKIAVSAVSLAALTLMTAHFNMSGQTKVNAEVSEGTTDKASNIYYDDEIYGDLNYDKKVDVTDLSLLSLCLIHDKDIKDPYILEMADVMSDGKVDIADLATLRQFVSRKIDEIGKFAGLKDITDQCVTIETGITSESWRENRPNERTMISSMDEYKDSIVNGPCPYFYHYPGTFEEKLLEKTGLELNDEFFEDHRLAVLTDFFETVNGVKFDLKSVKVNDRGDVNLYYDHNVPDSLTLGDGIVYHITVVPGNPKNDCQTYIHYNEINPNSRDKGLGKLKTVDSSEVKYDGKGDYPESTGMIASMDEFREQILEKGIDPYGAVRNLEISEEFFESNSLVYHTLAETKSDKYRYASIFMYNNNELYMYIYKYSGDNDNSSQETKYWFIGAAVPKRSINPLDVAEVKAEVYNEE